MSNLAAFIQNLSLQDSAWKVDNYNQHHHNRRYQIDLRRGESDTSLDVVFYCFDAMLRPLELLATLLSPFDDDHSANTEISTAKILTQYRPIIQ